MSPKWIIFLTTLWMFGSLFGLILEGAFPGEEEQTVLNTLMNCKVVTATSWLGKITGAITDLAMWWALLKMFIWDFSFWQGSLQLVRWMIFFPISIGILSSLLLAWFRGVGGG